MKCLSKTIVRVTAITKIGRNVLISINDKVYAGTHGSSKGKFPEREKYLGEPWRLPKTSIHLGVKNAKNERNILRWLRARWLSSAGRNGRKLWSKVKSTCCLTTNVSTESFRVSKYFLHLKEKFVNRKMFNWTIAWFTIIYDYTKHVQTKLLIWVTIGLCRITLVL